MKALGVIGGLGPLATAYFYELVTNMTDVTCDQDHIEILIHSRPQIPDRTGYIIGKSDKSPLPQMIEVGHSLEREGAQILAIPCITAHYFHEELTKNINVPIICCLNGEITDHAILISLLSNWKIVRKKEDFHKGHEEITK